MYTAYRACKNVTNARTLSTRFESSAGCVLNRLIKHSTPYSILQVQVHMLLPYSTYCKPMGDLPYISSEQGGWLIIHHGLIMRITIYKRPIPKNFELRRGGGLIIHHGLIICTIRYLYYTPPVPRHCMLSQSYSLSPSLCTLLSVSSLLLPNCIHVQ